MPTEEYTSIEEAARSVRDRPYERIPANSGKYTYTGNTFKHQAEASAHLKDDESSRLIVEPSKQLRRGLLMSLRDTSRIRPVVMELTYVKIKRLIATMLMHLENNSNSIHSEASSADSATLEIKSGDGYYGNGLNNRQLYFSYQTRHHSIYLPDQEYLNLLEYMLRWLESVENS